KIQWIEQPKYQQSPIPNAITVFTDAGRKSQSAVAAWQEDGRWRHKLLQAESTDSLQTLELWAVVWSLLHFTEPINIVTDSLYVANVANKIEDAYIKNVQNKRLFELLT
ncbi:POK19 protein, partial [Dyaphorophyia castanea]|nr:POK19 protein [Platysteira castanea]